MACALLFAGVSGWATFDRVVGAVENRAAGGEQRLIDLAEQQEEGRKRVADLDLQLAETRLDTLTITGSSMAPPVKAAPNTGTRPVGSEPSRMQVQPL